MGVHCQNRNILVELKRKKKKWIQTQS